MEDVVLVVATVIVGIGLALILWRELATAAERRRTGPLRDLAEVLLPVVLTVVLVVAAWAY